MGFDLFSPGCNCKLIFTPNNANGCEGTFTWCTKVGSTVILQKQVPGGLFGQWENVRTFQSNDSQFYTINTTSQHGTYRIQCELCPGKWATSDPIVTTLCGNQSHWWRWFKKNRIFPQWYPQGAYLEHIISSFYIVRDRYQETYGGTAQPGVYRKYPENFPIPYGCSNDYTTYRSGTVKIFSYSTLLTTTRAGYTFDYRVYHPVIGPSCSVGYSLTEIFPNRGLINMGGVSHRRDWTIDFEEIASYTLDYPFFTQGPIVPSSGENYHYTAFVDQTANISFFLPRFTDPYPFQWPDGTYTPSLPSDFTGNTFGIIQDNRNISKGESGTKIPPLSCGSNNTIYPNINDWNAFAHPKVVFMFGPSEHLVRTCQQASNGTNPLPPGTVLENDYCYPTELLPINFNTCIP